MKSLSITVSGRVQGVWFRKSTQDKAVELGLSGQVRNQPDGAVHILVTGENEPLNLLIDWCKEGPPLARVDHVQVEEIPTRTFESFDVLR